MSGSSSNVVTALTELSHNSNKETYIKSVFTCYQPAIYDIFLRNEMEINVISSKKSRKVGNADCLFGF